MQSNVPVNDSYAQLWGRKSQGGYTVVTYIGSLPAVLTGTKAGYLHRYKIYGNTEQIGTPTPENPIVPSECGERTENLWKYTSSMRNITWWSRNPSTAYFVYYQLSSEQVNVLKSAGNISLRMFLKDGGVHKAGLTAAITNSNGIPGANIRLLQSDGTIVSQTFNAKSWSNAYLVVGNSGTVTGDLADVNIQSLFDNYDIAIVEGSTAPTSYIPYGYKLPLASGNTPVDIYIGDYTLSTEEYVDSGTGKIYRMVNGTLTPVDPPVPFPQIPTSAGSTTISWAGEGLAPSKVELEYEKKR